MLRQKLTALVVIAVTSACAGGDSTNTSAMGGEGASDKPAAGMAAPPPVQTSTAGHTAGAAVAAKAGASGGGVGGQAAAGAAGVGTAGTPAAGASGSAIAGSAAGGAGGSGAAAGVSGSAAAGSAAAGNAAAGSGGAGETGVTAAPLTSLMYPTTQEKVSEQPIFHITRPKDLTLAEGPRPVVAWANGGCFRSDFTWQPLFDRWAGAGFVVLSLTGSGSDDDLGSMLDSTTDKEHAALLDWVVKANESGAYAGKLDLTRIVLAGNSCGGVTALQTASKDKRAAAVFVLSGSSAVGSVDKQIMQAISIPVGYVTGNPSEDVAAPNAADDYEALNDGIPAMLVQRKTGDHITVSTDEKVLPQDAEIALNWMDLALYGNKQARAALTSPNVCEHCTPGDWTFKAKNLDKLVK